MQLDWYLTDWTQTTNTIDYAIKSVESSGNTTKVVLERIGLMPMPLDILIVGENGSNETYYVPLQIMRGEKDNPYPQLERTVAKDWAWAHPTYELVLNRPLDSIEAIAIDPSQLMADVDKENNVFQVSE